MSCLAKAKIGDSREDGLVLWERRKGKEWWVTPEKFQIKQQKRRKSECLRQQRCCAQLKEYRQGYYRQNRESIRQQHKEYYAANRSSLRPVANAYAARNRSNISAREKAKYHTDKLCALRVNARSRILQAIRSLGYTKKSRTFDLLGCSWEDFKNHLESQFRPGMTWENRGRDGWHIDHIVPLASASSPEELEKLCRFTNTQPLWAGENLRKGCRQND